MFSFFFLLVLLDHRVKTHLFLPFSSCILSFLFTLFCSSLLFLSPILYPFLLVLSSQCTALSSSSPFLLTLSSSPPPILFFSPSTPLVAMYREPSLHDVGEAVPKLAGGPPSKSTTSEPVVMNGGKPVSKPDKEET